MRDKSVQLTSRFVFSAPLQILMQQRTKRLKASPGSPHCEDMKSTEADILSGVSQECNASSGCYWFTEFCNSQRLSRFAAPFIGARAKISVAESCVEACAQELLLIAK